MRSHVPGGPLAHGLPGARGPEQRGQAQPRCLPCPARELGPCPGSSHHVTVASLVLCQERREQGRQLCTWTLTGSPPKLEHRLPSSGRCHSVAQSCPTLCSPMNYMPGFPVLHQLLEFAQTHVHQVSDAIQPLIFFRPLVLLPSIFPSIRVFSNESALQFRWPKYWSFSISPSNEYSGLISFRIDLIDLLAVQGTLKSLCQHHTSLKPSVLRCSDFFMVQLLHAYMTTRKTIALTMRTFVGKVMSLIFDTL